MPKCWKCNDTGLRVVERAGPPNQDSTSQTWSSTTYQTCECMVIQSNVWPMYPPNITVKTVKR